MEIAFQVVSLSVLAAVLCVVVRENQKTLSMLLSLAACIGGLLLVLRILEPVFSMVEQLRALSKLSSTATGPLWKILGIGILTRVAGSVCQDAGEGALANVVEITGTLLSVYVSLPLLMAVLDMMEEMLGG